jgi:hypothetical protein
MSPASGDNTINSLLVDRIYASFHSINVPSEWGLPMSVHLQDVPTTVSIQLMSPASGDTEEQLAECQRTWHSFHSINVPSEWGLRRARLRRSRQNLRFPFN